MARRKTAERLIHLKARLEEVRAAISRTLLAESYGTGSRRLQRVNLDSLRKLEKELEEEIGMLDGGLGRMKRIIPVDW